MANQLKEEYQRAQDMSRRYGAGLEHQYQERATSYDPYAAADRASQATGQRMFEDFGQQLGDLRGAMVGRGRLRTGFGAEDENRAYRGFEDRLASMVASNSMQAAGLDLNNIQGMGSYGAAASNRYLDLLSGERDRQMMEENYRRQRSGGLWGGLGALAGGLAGSLIPGAGTAIGGSLGASIGGSLGRGIGGY